MTLQGLASIADVIGAIAIVVSLIYVGIQVNDNARAVRSTGANEVTGAISSFYSNIGSSQQASRLWVTAMRCPETLSAEDFAQFIFLAHGLILQYQTAYYLSEEGTLDKELREAITNNLAGVRELPGFLKFWGQRRSVFKPSFRQFVDDVIANSETNSGFEELYRTHDRD